jgi:hypothetical protein
VRLAVARVLRAVQDRHLLLGDCRAWVLEVKLTDVLRKEDRPLATTTWGGLAKPSHNQHERTYRFRLDSTPSEGPEAATAVDMVEVESNGF